MLDKIMKVSEDEYMIIFDSKPPVTVTGEYGKALHLVEYILSPRFDMGYSEYLSVIRGESEDTNIIMVKDL